LVGDRLSIADEADAEQLLASINSGLNGWWAVPSPSARPLRSGFSQRPCDVVERRFFDPAASRPEDDALPSWQGAVFGRPTLATGLADAFAIDDSMRQPGADGRRWASPGG
jgi:hypothetical protein